MFALREINQIERETCFYLEWQLIIDSSTGPSSTGAGAVAVHAPEFDQCQLEFFR
jgi:hypothetical protein